MFDYIVKISTENQSFKNKIASYVEKLLEESNANISKQNIYGKKTNFVMSRMEKQTKKQK